MFVYRRYLSIYLGFPLPSAVTPVKTTLLLDLLHTTRLNMKTLVRAQNWIHVHAIHQPSASFFVLSISCSAFLFFQMAFASASATIVSGAMLERTKHQAYNVWTICIVTFSKLLETAHELQLVSHSHSAVYSPVVHWVWSSTGWLR